MSEQWRADKMKRNILVVKTQTIYQDHQFEWFVSSTDVDLEETILSHAEYLERGLMEQDPSYQQPIPYALIVNPQTKCVIAYQRGGNNSATGEHRLYERRSLWVWGHVEQDEQDTPNPLDATIRKEVQEETGLTTIDQCTIIWYINDNSDQVGKVHLGVVYLITTSDTNVTVVDGEMQQVYFKTIQEIDDMITSDYYDVESWSRIVREHCKSLIEKL